MINRLTTGRSTFELYTLNYLVWDEGFEPSTSPLQTEDSDQTELIPDKIDSNDWIRTSARTRMKSRDRHGCRKCRYCRSKYLPLPAKLHCLKNLEQISRFELELFGWKPNVLPLTLHLLWGMTLESNQVCQKPRGYNPIEIHISCHPFKNLRASNRLLVFLRKPIC